MKIPSKPMSPK